MPTLSEVLQAIYDELRAIVVAETSVAEPDDHVGVLDRTLDIQTPFFGFEWDLSPLSRGMGGNIRSGGYVYDGDGDVVGVTEVRDYTLFLDIGAVVDGDAPELRDTYLDDVQSHFSQFVGSESDLLPGIERIREQGALPSGGGDSRDIGYRLTYEIRFCTSTDRTVPTAETVNLDVDADGTDAHPEQNQ